jgi:Uncharacterised nucleotidyltransferase
MPADQPISDVEVFSTILTGAWRRTPPVLSAKLTQAHLSRTSSLFSYSGTTGLAWNRVKRSHLRRTPQGNLFKSANREIALTQLLQEDALHDAIEVLSSAGSLPLLFKGWAAARFFAVPELRPFGDVDVCVPAVVLPKIAILLQQRANSVSDVSPAGVTFHITNSQHFSLTIDLHKNLDRFHLAPVSDVFDRAQKIKIQKSEFLIPCHEDHLRIAAMHFLNDGGWRPLSLCDVAAMVEAAPVDFDWDLCMGADPRVAGWIAAAIALAHHLLGADIHAVPAKYRLQTPPAWLHSTVLKEWRAPFASRVRRPPFAWVVRHPHTLWHELKARWPNPLVATMSLNQPIDDAPPLRRQLKCFGLRAARFALRAAR